MATTTSSSPTRSPAPAHRSWADEELHRGRLAFEKYCEALVEQRKPLANLPLIYRVTQARPNPPILAFGILRTRQQLFEYTQKHDLRHPDRPDVPLYPMVCMVPSLTRLREEAKEPFLSIIPVFSPGEEDWHVVTLYTNYTMRSLQCTEDDEKDIIMKIQEELGTSERPMWYWDELNPW
ncbi:hypothetical protein BV25DRAFT_1841537 [Artomyces pyxidatus]|uniref:Uncharacterized protein n=1 Tax=Artomyces pyxidatus TaxID=48021 RepID=A0ACB8SN57_9AGAM|nr:hypothetical protein BV25DRAFT_1841537 [Artomyces pyxidatus]